MDLPQPSCVVERLLSFRGVLVVVEHQEEVVQPFAFREHEELRRDQEPYCS